MKTVRVVSPAPRPMLNFEFFVIRGIYTEILDPVPPTLRETIKN